MSGKGFPGRRRAHSTAGVISQEYEMVPVASLFPHPRNVNQGDVEAIVSSIRHNQFFGAVTAQKSSCRIIAGKHRWLGAQKCGLAEIPVIWADVDDEAALRMMLVDNRTTRLGADDPAALAELLSSLPTLDGTGFDAAALQELLDELSANIAQPAENEPKLQPEKLKGASLEDLAPTEEERSVLANRKLLIEYSGGKDSTAAAIWARHYFPDNKTELLFVDLGADFVGFHLYLHDSARFLGVPLMILRSKQTVIEAMLAKGEWPHFLHPYCHENLYQPLDDYMHTHAPGEIVILRGGRLSERARSGKKNATRFLEVERMKAYRYFQPLYFSDKDTSTKLLEEASVPIWEGYSRGLCRTACRICPGQRPYAYSAIRANYPEVWAELLDLERRFGPGAWQGQDEKGSASFTALADPGQEKFEGR